jgi:hypothetical protein
VAARFFRQEDFTDRGPRGGGGGLIVLNDTPVTQPGKKKAPGSSSQAFVAIPIALALGTVALLVAK